MGFSKFTLDYLTNKSQIEGELDDASFREGCFDKFSEGVFLLLPSEVFLLFGWSSPQGGNMLPEKSHDDYTRVGDKNNGL